MKEFILHTFVIYILLAVNIKFSEAQDGPSDVSKSQFPFMAFLYYPDETITKNSNRRYFQNAILIKVDWLISASTDIGNNAFPIKTLIARAGVVIVDQNFTLNEDDGEQEREIVQVVLPEKHNSSMKLETDISLLKTLLPFNVTQTVVPYSLNLKFETDTKLCKILAFVNTRYLERKLVQMTIELLPPKECGDIFIEDKMACGSDAQIKPEYKEVVSSKEFCEDNTGGPLLCDNEMMGIQVYLEKKECLPPRFYHLFPKWNKFIHCGTNLFCRKDVCDGVCKITYKDEIVEKPITLSTTSVKVVEMLDSDKSPRIAPVFRTPSPLEESKSTVTKETSEPPPTQKTEVTKLKSSSETTLDTTPSVSKSVTTLAPETIATNTPEVVTTSTSKDISTTTLKVVSTTIPNVTSSAQVKLVSAETRRTNLTINTYLPLSPNSSMPETKTRKSKKYRRNGTEKLYFFADLLFGVFFTKWFV